MWNYKFDKNIKISEFNKLTVGIILKHCKGFNDSLELGAGTGDLSYLLKENSKNMKTEYIPYMVDSSGSASHYILESFHARGEYFEGSDYHLFNQSVFTFNVDKTFDLVMSSGFIEHYKNDWLENIVKIHKEFSSKYIVCIVPNATEENIKFSGSERCKNLYEYERPMSEAELDLLFVDDIFKKVHAETFYKKDKLLIGIYTREK